MLQLMCKFSQERINTVIYIVVVELIKLTEEMDCERCQDIIMCLFVTISQLLSEESAEQRTANHSKEIFDLLSLILK